MSDIGSVTTTGAVWGLCRPLPPAGPLPSRAEVVIVGGGVTGVAVLGALRARGVDAILVERDRLAAGASGRNAGFLLAGVAENYARAVVRYGRSTAVQVWRFSLENHALITALASRLDAGHRVHGSLTVALDAAESASLEEAATLLAEDGLPGSLTRHQELAGSMGELFNPADGEIDPVRLVAGLAAAHAGRIHENCRVVAVKDGSRGAVAELGDASVEASAVVLATNAWTAELLPSAPITAVRAQMLATAPAPPCVSRPVYADWGHRYWRQREDGTVLVGGFRHRALRDEVGFDVTPTPVVQAHLEEQLRALVGGARVTHRWAGTMGFSADGLPLVGLVDGSRHVHVCAGYTGHGMGLAVNAAAVLVRRMLDGEPLPPWLDAARRPQA